MCQVSDLIFNHVVVRLPRLRMEVTLSGEEATYQQDHAAIQIWASNHAEVLGESSFIEVGRITATQFPRVVHLTVTDPESGCGVEVHPGF